MKLDRESTFSHIQMPRKRLKTIRIVPMLEKRGLVIVALLWVELRPKAFTPSDPIPRTAV